MATWFSDVPEHYILARHPKDSKYLNLAITANAAFLVTDDLDLVELMEAESATGQDFRARFPSLQIVSPAAFEAIVIRPAS